MAGAEEALQGLKAPPHPDELETAFSDSHGSDDTSFMFQLAANRKGEQFQVLLLSEKKKNEKRGRKKKKEEEANGRRVVRASEAGRLIGRKRVSF